MRFASLAVVALGLSACGVSEPILPRPTDLAPSAIPPPAKQVQPVTKVLLAVDLSSGEEVADPQGLREVASGAYLKALRAVPSSQVAILGFGPRAVWITNSGAEGFVPALGVSDAVVDELVSVGAPSYQGMDPGFTGALGAIAAAIADDRGRSGPDAPPSDYRVILVSDGDASGADDAQLFQSCSAIHALASSPSSVALDAVMIFEPLVPPSAGSATLAVDAQRLQTMAQLGGGVFREFLGDASVSFTGL